MEEDKKKLSIGFIGVAIGFSLAFASLSFFQLTSEIKPDKHLASLVQKKEEFAKERKNTHSHNQEEGVYKHQYKTHDKKNINTSFSHDSENFIEFGERANAFMKKEKKPKMYHFKITNSEEQKIMNEEKRQQKREILKQCHRTTHSIEKFRECLKLSFRNNVSDKNWQQKSTGEMNQKKKEVQEEGVQKKEVEKKNNLEGQIHFRKQVQRCLLLDPNHLKECIKESLQGISRRGSIYDHEDERGVPLQQSEKEEEIDNSIPTI